jgi:hypothetical protein
MNRPRLSRLRLATSALGLAACAFILASWVRSYCTIDDLRAPLTASRTVRIESKRGTLSWQFFDATWGAYVHKSTWNATRMDPPWERWDAHVPTWRWIQPAGLGPEMFILPYWFPTVLAAALTVTPWMSLRFSLRKMLIAVTLLAGLLGAIALSK